MADAPVDGIAQEYAGAEFGDPRRSRRLVGIAGRLAEEPGLSFPKAFSEAELEGAYRFFRNEAVQPDDVLKPHVNQTLERMRESAVSLVLHDSSTLSFGSEGYRDGLGESSGGHQHFLAHCSLAVSGDGSRTPHGVLAVSRHIVGEGEKGALQDRWLTQAKRVQGLVSTPVVHVMDREADDFELLTWLSETNSRFIIRMQHNRGVAGGKKLRDELPSIEPRAQRTVVLGRRTGHYGPKQKRINPPRRERTARLAIGGATLELKAPGRRRVRPSLELNVVHVREIEPPNPKEPVEWTLLTNEPVETTEQLLRVVDWYRARWIIEELFKVLKTGCSFEKRQLGCYHSLSNALAIFLPIAWRLLLLRTVARDAPDAPARHVLDHDELTVLRSAARKPLPDKPTARDVLLAVAALGGHLKRNGEPGWQTIGAGYEKLRTLTEGWQLARAATST
jgi:hypothetical protein